MIVNFFLFFFFSLLIFSFSKKGLKIFVEWFNERLCSTVFVCAQIEITLKITLHFRLWLSSSFPQPIDTLQTLSMYFLSILNDCKQLFHFYLKFFLFKKRFFYCSWQRPFVYQSFSITGMRISNRLFDLKNRQSFPFSRFFNVIEHLHGFNAIK